MVECDPRFAECHGVARQVPAYKLGTMPPIREAPTELCKAAMRAERERAVWDKSSRKIPE